MIVHEMELALNVLNHISYERSSGGSTTRFHTIVEEFVCSSTVLC
jgi:hypothetical protein